LWLAWIAGLVAVRLPGAEDPTLISERSDDMTTSMDAPKLGSKALDFDLEGVDGRRYRLADVCRPKGTLVMFICNHCPFVQAAIDRVASNVGELRKLGVGAVAIMPNDTQAYPTDSFANMKAFASRHGLTFPYVIDETQAIARAYGAVCTPEFFGFNAALELQYHGRLDEGKTTAPRPGARRELLEAMRLISEAGEGPKEQVPSMGCSIKWRHTA
jgi:peroxiredoxin